MPKKLNLKSRQEWRKWLQKNHDKLDEVWLIYYKVHTKKPRIPYDDAVEEAICFGWIDGKVRSIDEEKYMQRYTPRKTTTWSELNEKRAKKMIKLKKMTPAGLEKYKKRRKELILPQNPRTPPDLKQALSKNKKAEANWKKFPTSYRRHWIWWVISAKQEETRKRRIKKVVEKAKLNKKPGE